MGEHLPLELDDVTQPNGTTFAEPETVLPRGDELVISLGHPELKRGIPLCLKRGGRKAKFRRYITDLLRRLQNVQPVSGPQVFDRPTAQVRIGLIPKGDVPVHKFHVRNSAATLVTQQFPIRNGRGHIYRGRQGLVTTTFASSLREWRSRRRVSQLELAMRAGTTQRHISFIENGRSAPGRAMVVRLAESLEVPLRERNVMLLTAGFAPAYQEARLDDPRLDAVRTALERIMEGHMPYPAVIIDRQGDLIASNKAFTALIDGVAPRLLEPPVSVSRVLLHPEGLASRIVNLAEWAWHIIDAIGKAAARNPNARLQTLITELEGLVPDRPRQPGPDYLGFAVPMRLRHGDGELRLLTTLTHFGTATDVALAELKLEAFLPADEETASALAANLNRG